MTEKKSDNRTWIWIVVAVVAVGMILACCVAALAGVVIYKAVDQDYSYGRAWRMAPQMPDLPEMPELPRRYWDDDSSTDRGPMLRLMTGAVLTEVIEDSPADDAGLLAGDVIFAVDGRELSDEYTLYDAVIRLKPGDEIEVDVWSHGDTDTVEIVLGAHPEDADVAWLGVRFTIMDMPEGMRKYRDRDQ